jgi:hypothetical protein
LQIRDPRIGSPCMIREPAWEMDMVNVQIRDPRMSENR